jgi:4'-phosphopantetheinyl transferase
VISAARTLAAPAGVALWEVPLDVGPAQAEKAERLLDDAERRRAARFRSRELRQRYAVAHAALRLLLAESLGIDPLAVELGTLEGGKPALALDRSLDFNLSHCGDLALVAISSCGAVGVDVECIGPVEVGPLASRVCTPAERAALASLAPPDRTCAFLRLWTAKEAYLKARGTGLQEDPAGLDVVAVLTANEVELPDDYRVHGVDAGPDHAAALALGRKGA